MNIDEEPSRTSERAFLSLFVHVFLIVRHRSVSSKHKIRPFACLRCCVRSTRDSPEEMLEKSLFFPPFRCWIEQRCKEARGEDSSRRDDGGKCSITRYHRRSLSFSRPLLCESVQRRGDLVACLRPRESFFPRRVDRSTLFVRPKLFCLRETRRCQREVSSSRLVGPKFAKLRLLIGRAHNDEERAINSMSLLDSALPR